MPVTVERVTDILRDSREAWDAGPGGRPVAEYLPEGYRPAGGYVELDGRPVPFERLEALPVPDGSRLLLVDVPGGPTAGFIGLFVVSIGMNVAMQLVSAEQYNQPTADEPDYPGSWSMAPSTIGAGHSVPLVYGKVRASGHIIESFVSSDFETVPDTDSLITTNSGLGLPRPDSEALYTRIGLCAGPVKSIASIWIDDNPVASLYGVSYQTVLGETSQPPMVGFSESKRSTAIGSTVSYAGGAVVQRTTGPVDSVELTFTFGSGLFTYDAADGLTEREIQLAITYKKASAVSYTTWKTISPSARRRDAYKYQVRLPNLDRDIYDVRVVRLTADNTDPNISDVVTWTSMNEVLFGASTHPGLAQMAFQHLPQVEISVPSSYSAEVEGFDDVRIYSSVSAYTNGWTNNPAWCWAHWVTHAEHGLGRAYTYDDIDISELIAWAVHCDSSVSDGVGGTEERCHFDAEFREGLSADEILLAFEVAGEAFLIEEGGTWRIVIDEDADPVGTLTDGAYLDGSLSWSFVGSHDRPTKVIGVFANEDRDYEKDSIVVEETLEGEETHKEESIFLLGVTRVSQALRAIKRRLAWYRLANESIEFETGMDGWQLRAGQIIRFASTHGEVGLASGRLLRVDTAALVLQLDAEVELETGSSYEITVAHSDGTTETKSLSVSADETTDYVSLAGGTTWTTTPAAGDLYSVALAGESVKEFRVIRTALGAGHTRKVTAILHDSDVYDDTIDATDGETHFRYGGERHLEVDTIDVTARAPEDDAGNEFWRVIDVAWQRPIDGIAWDYEVFIRRDGEESVHFVGRTKDSHMSFLWQLEPGSDYDVTVDVVASDGTRTPWSAYTTWETVSVPG